MYQVIHAGYLWSSVGRVTAKSGAMGKAQPWIERAAGARDNVFHEYVLATTDSQRAGAITTTHAPARISHMVTTLVDGFLFQTTEERIMAEEGIETKADYLQSLIRLAISGLRVASRQ